MEKENLLLGIVVISLMVLVSSCGPRRPFTQIVDAQLAIKEAKEAGAEEYAQERLKSAENYLTQALKTKKKKESIELAGEARIDAEIAGFVAQRERKRVEEEKRLAYQKAKETITQAQEAINKAEGEDKEVVIAKNRLKNAQVALESERFKEAEGMAQEARKLAQEAKTRLPQFYQVKKGETLKIIAGKVYGDPDKWTLVYKANKDRIKNANLIYPGQRLVIPREE